MRVLGIESSCDDTALAVVDSTGAILCDVRASQVNVHSKYNGVVPELAAREHVMSLRPLLDAVENKMNARLSEVIDAIAVTRGPGLIGSLMVGVSFASGLALGLNKPLIGVNHLAAHALSPRLTDGLAYPYLLLLASGGHCLFARVADCFTFDVLGETLDDAAGEAFDKVAAMLSLGFPGGPAVEKAAAMGHAARYPLSLPLAGQKTGNMSFSGLKNAVRLLIQKHQPLSLDDKADIAASFQHTVCQHLSKTLERHLKAWPEVPALAIAGGVAANGALRTALSLTAQRYNKTIVIPEASYAPTTALWWRGAGLSGIGRGLGTRCRCCRSRAGV